VAKHAGACEVEVTLARDDGLLAVSVRDDGCGFDPDGPRGLGLTGLTDRLDTLGGSLAVESGPGAGTVLRMRVPQVPGGCLASSPERMTVGRGV
jgi:signal transduction histidine kinase